MKLPPNKVLRWLPWPPYAPVIQDRDMEEPTDEQD